jgi:hypothetical protein
MTNWILGEAIRNDPPTNRIFFTPVPMTNAAMFFRAKQAPAVISLQFYQEAVETNLANAGFPNGQPGIFGVLLNGGRYSTNIGGSTLGDMFYGNGAPGGIGWMSRDSSAWKTNWISLPGETIGIRGALYVDQGGAFGGDLIAVAGDASLRQGGGVWRINSRTNATLLANLGIELEGVITLPTDARYGPLAGKIVTGSETATDAGLITIDTNGIVTHWDLGVNISTECFRIIPTNQDLYLCTQATTAPDQVVKLSHTLLTNFWGDLLIVQEGQQSSPINPAVFIIRWDPTSSVFLLWRIRYTQVFEDATFAPISLPSSP